MIIKNPIANVQNIHINKNSPLSSWHHGDKSDVSKWLWWKQFSLSLINLKSVQPPSKTWRLWIYTRRRAFDFDFTIDKRMLP